MNGAHEGGEVEIFRTFGEPLEQRLSVSPGVDDGEALALSGHLGGECRIREGTAVDDGHALEIDVESKWVGNDLTNAFETDGKRVRSADCGLCRRAKDDGGP